MLGVIGAAALTPTPAGPGPIASREASSRRLNPSAGKEVLQCLLWAPVVTASQARRYPIVLSKTAEATLKDLGVDHTQLWVVLQVAVTCTSAWEFARDIRTYLGVSWKRGVCQLLWDELRNVLGRLDA